MAFARILLLVGAVLLALAAPAAAQAQGKDRPPVEVQLLGLNDFHGALETPTGGQDQNKPPQKKQD